MRTGAPGKWKPPTGSASRTVARQESSGLAPYPLVCYATGVNPKMDRIALLVRGSSSREMVIMRAYGRFFWLGSGLVLGLVASALFFHNEQTALASSNDRFEDYIMCTGAVGITPRAPTDGLWMLDYRRGKLMGTVIDRSQGKIIGWADLDLVPEFGCSPGKMCT